MKNLTANKFCYFTKVFSHIYLSPLGDGELLFNTESDYRLSVNLYSDGFEYKFTNPNGQILEENTEKVVDLKNFSDKITSTVNKYLGVLK